MFKRLITFTILISIIVLTGCLPDVGGTTNPIEKTGDITGVVTFPASALDKVAVVYLDENKSQITNGSFKFTDVTVGTHILRIDSALYGSDKVTVQLTEDGSNVELKAVQTQVTALVDGNNQVRLMITPEFPSNVQSIKVEWANTLDGSYSEWGTIAKGDIFVRSITEDTDPETRYYLRLTHLDSTGAALAKVYNQLLYYPAVTLLTPSNSATATKDTVLKWQPVASGVKYRVRIMSTDYTYGNVSAVISETEMLLGNHFPDLTNNTYTWEVTAMLQDGTNASLSQDRARIRSKEWNFTYQNN